VQLAVSQNYTSKKYADVICIEDIDGFLTMIPSNQAFHWATIKGEIRPGGRNKKKVWTPKKLTSFIEEKGGKTVGDKVIMHVDNFDTAGKRGGSDEVNRYKINSIFFIYAKNITIENNFAHFQIKNVYQLKPTISAHMFFKKLRVNEVRSTYGMDF
jgi:general stress protein YciG